MAYGKITVKHQITRGTFNLEQLCIKLIDNLISNMHSRFPNTSLLSAFGVLSLRPIAFMSEGLWTTSKPLINAEQTQEEWALVKKVVKAQHYPKDSMWRLWALVTKYHQDDFPNLTILAQLATTLAVHTAGCEQGFSSQNLILTPHRYRLTLEHQEQLLKVNLGQSSLLKWHLRTGNRSREGRCTR